VLQRGIKEARCPFRTSYEYDALNRRVKAHVDSDATGGPDTWVHGKESKVQRQEAAACDHKRVRHRDCRCLRFPLSHFRFGSFRIPKSAFRASPSLQPHRQVVWSVRYTDALVRRDANDDADDHCDDETLYVLGDANFNTTALVNAAGTVLERYVYDPYGRVTVTDGTWTGRAGSLYESTVLFAGYWRDTETGLYHVRNRMYHVRLGLWLIRDPLGYVDGMSLYAYVRSSPTALLDPTGTFSPRRLEDSEYKYSSWDQKKWAAGDAIDKWEMLGDALEMISGIKLPEKHPLRQTQGKVCEALRKIRDQVARRFDGESLDDAIGKVRERLTQIGEKADAVRKSADAIEGSREFAEFMDQGAIAEALEGLGKYTNKVGDGAGRLADTVGKLDAIANAVSAVRSLGKLTMNIGPKDLTRSRAGRDIAQLGDALSVMQSGFDKVGLGAFVECWTVAVNAIAGATHNISWVHGARNNLPRWRELRRAQHEGKPGYGERAIATDVINGHKKQYAFGKQWAEEVLEDAGTQLRD